MTDISEVFVPKPAADITADLIELVRGSTDRLTDFNIGSITRTLLEAHAEELDDYYQAIYYGLLKAIPAAIYIGFGFEIIPATAASGEVQFTRLGDIDRDLTIPLGTLLVSSNGARFRTQSALTFATGQEQGTVLVRAEVAGASGNAPANTVALSQPVGTLEVTNPIALYGGVDAETEDQRAERFALFVRSLARGTLAAVQYIASVQYLTDGDGVISERVRRQSVYEEPGHVMLYVDNGSWGISDELLAQVQLAVDGYRDPNTQQWIGGYRPAGMRVEVAPMARQAFDVAMEVSSTASQAVVELDIQTRLEAYLADILRSQTVRMIDLINVVLAVDGVNSVVITTPSANVTVPNNTVLYLRNLDITWIA